MSETVQIALITVGIPACITLILYGGKTVDWMVVRWEKRRDAKAAERERRHDQEEARKTTRVLLETIELKNEELMMKDSVIAMKDGVIADLLQLLEAARDGSRP